MYTNDKFIDSTVIESQNGRQMKTDTTVVRGGSNHSPCSRRKPVSSLFVGVCRLVTFWIVFVSHELPPSPTVFPFPPSSSIGVRHCIKSNIRITGRSLFGSAVFFHVFFFLWIGFDCWNRLRARRGRWCWCSLILAFLSFALTFTSGLPPVLGTAFVLAGFPFL